MSNIKKFFVQLYNPLGFRLNRIKEIEDFSIARVNKEKKTSMTLNNYITAPEYAE